MNGKKYIQIIVFLIMPLCISMSPLTSRSIVQAASVAAARPDVTKSCAIHYNVHNQWQGGFTANITISNTGSSDVNLWTLMFPFPTSTQSITGVWNSTFSAQGAIISIKNGRRNKIIAAGTSAILGFNGLWSKSNPSPTIFILNGIHCTLD